MHAFLFIQSSSGADAVQQVSDCSRGDYATAAIVPDVRSSSQPLPVLPFQDTKDEQHVEA